MHIITHVLVQLYVHSTPNPNLDDFIFIHTLLSKCNSHSTNVQNSEKTTHSYESINLTLQDDKKKKKKKKEEKKKDEVKEYVWDSVVISQSGKWKLQEHLSFALWKCF